MKLAKNYLYNLSYQFLTLIVPIITIPYISRVLGSSGIGINAFTNSVIQYFVLFGTMGILLYGNREIAYVRADKSKLSQTFWAILSLKLITGSISYICFLIFLLFLDDYKQIFLIQSIFIVASTLDISWLYMGLEDFKKTVLRNVIIKLIGVICTFIFVKDIDDLWKYIFILTFSQLLGNISLWFYLPKTVHMVKIKWDDIRIHIFPSLTLFIPQIAIQIYLVLNKTMLGIFSNTNEVGFFDNADKIVKIILSIVTSLGIVMLPRISNTFAKGDIDQVKKYIYHSFDFTSYLAFPLMFGLAAVAQEFSPWFFGAEFHKTGTLLLIISPVVIFIAWSNVIGQQYLMPTGKMKGYTISVLVGAVSNLILNLVLIHQYHSIGTALATVCAELLVFVLQIYWVRNEIQIKKIFNGIWKYILASGTMYIIVKLIGIYNGGGLLTLFLQIIIGVILYTSILFLLKSKMNSKLFKMCLKLFYRPIGK